MNLDPISCHRVLGTRDARFDGRFFVGVRTTGVYCRPICPARTPKIENCLFFACSAAAQDAGFRPCLRCRPESSPGTPAWAGSSVTVSRALRMIAEGALDSDNVETLAARLGVGERQLRRLFMKHLGTTPISVAQNRRLLFAKKLINETALPMSRIAFAAGYSSIRRFNDAISATYGRSPRELRGNQPSTRNGKAGSPKSAPGNTGLALKLPYRAPLAWKELLAFLSMRAAAGVEVVSADTYARSVCVDGVHGTIAVAQPPGQAHLIAHVVLPESVSIIGVVEKLRALFDLGADPEQISRDLRGDPTLRPLLRAQPGLRVPGAWDGFELAVRAILGQQVSVRGATTMMSRVVQTWGMPLVQTTGTADKATAALTHVFPRAEVLANAKFESIGVVGARARTIRTVAAQVATGELRLDAHADLSQAIERLLALPGIGDWTANYIAMRAMREPDAFPASDLGLRKAAADKNGDTPTARELEDASDAWRPWRAYAAMHLWRRHSTNLAEPTLTSRKATKEKAA